MNKSRLIVVAIASMLCLGISSNAQSKSSSKPGPIEMPKETEVQVIPDDESFKSMISNINNIIVLKSSSDGKSADVYIVEDEEEKLIYKAKFNDTGVDPKLNARIYNNKIYSTDGKTLLFTYETETAATSIIKFICSVPEKKSTILDFSKIYAADEYTMGKVETFKKFPIFLYYSSFDGRKQ